MPTYTTTDIRNLALVGHAGSGKTSLMEALLKAGGAIHQIGLVEKGTTVSDFTEEEKEHGSSIYSAVAHCDHGGKRINIIDTPGGPDFVGQALGAFYAVETVAVVVNAQAGVEPNTRRMMERAEKAGCGRIIVINKIDAENVDLPAVVAAIQETFGTGCLPINLPADGGTRVVNCFYNKEGDSDLGPVADAHTAIVEQVVEMEDALMEKYFEDGDVDPEKLHDAFEEALLEGHLIPICFTVARHHTDPETSVGVEELLEIIEKLMPNPAEGKPRVFTNESGEDLPAEPDPAKPGVAHTFKVVNDRFGKMGVFRVHQGTVSKDTPMHIGSHKKPARISHVYSVQGKDHIDTDAIIAGDIGAVVKIDEVDIGEVLHAESNGQLKLKGENYPEPMHGLAITPTKRGDEQKLADALTKLASEDPTFRWGRDATTGETVMSGVGEQHVRLILNRMKEKYGVEVDTSPPKIAYRETILGKAEGHHRHKKQTGGAGQFGEVYLRVEPLEKDSEFAKEQGGSGLEFVDGTFGGNPPKQFLPAIEKGVKQVMEHGAVAGYPMQDIRVEVYDGKHHDVDSKEVAFITAGKRAFIDAVNKAKPALLEPIVHLEVTVPNANMGDITGDLSGKRGRIQGTDMLPGDMASISAQVPLAEVTNYQSQLKSVTGGQGSYTMELSHYEAVPGNVQAQIVAQYKPREEED